MTRLAVASKEVALRIVGPRDAAFIPRVQRVSAEENVPVNDVDELGNPNHAGISKDPKTSTFSFTVLDTGIKLFSVLTGVDANNYPAEGVSTQELGEADFILYIKDARESDYVKSIHTKRMQIRDFTYNFSVDGEAEESYTAVGSEKRYFKNDVIVDKFTDVGATSFALSETPTQLKNGDYILSVILDGTYLVKADDPANMNPGEYSYDSSNNTVNTYDALTSQILIVYRADPSGDNWVDISDDTMPAAIKGGDIGIVISSNNIPRVQSVTINGNMQVQEVREMGTRSVVGYQRQVPSVDGRIRVLDTDTELIDLLLSGSVNSGDVEWSVGEGCSAAGLDLEIKLYDPCDTTASGTVLKTYYLPSIEIVGDTNTYNVNENGVVEFQFRSTDAKVIVYSGARE